MATTDFKSQIAKCLVSSDSFKANMGPIREELAAQKKETVKIFLDTISQIISDKKEAPTSRFYALYFLKIATEHSNPMLVSYLFARKELLKTLEQQAAFDKDKKFPHRGAFFFSTSPADNERATGNNYIALILEMIKYWDRKYGSTDSEGKDNAPRSLYKRLSEGQKVPFPENFFYYKSQNQGQKAGQPQPQAQAQKASEKNMTQSEKLTQQMSEKKKPDAMAQSSTQGMTVQKQTSTSKPANMNEISNGKQKETKTQGGDNTLEVQKKLSSLKGAKVEILQIYETNEGPLEPDVLQIYYDDMIAIHKQLSELLDGFFSSGLSANNESIVADIMRQNDQIDVLIKEFQKFSAGATKWPDHRQNVLIFLRKDKAAFGATPGNQQDKQKSRSSEELKISKTPSPTLLNPAVQLEKKPDAVSRQTDAANAKKQIEEEKVDQKTVQQQNKGAVVQTKPETAKQTTAKAQKDEEEEEEEEGEEGEEEEEEEEAGGIDSETEERLIGDARKVVATIVTNFASDLYEDGDHPDPSEEDKHKAKQEQRAKEEKIKEEQRLKEERAKEEQRIKEEKAKEEQRLKEEKAKEEQRLKEEKVKEEKAKEEQRLKDEKAKEEQRLKEEKAKEEQRLKAEKVKEEAKVNEKEIKQDTSSDQAQRMSRTLAKSMGLDSSVIAQKYADELKLMSQSIKMARNRSGDMQKIKEGIKQSFINRNRQPPNYKDVLDQGLLKNLEEQLEKLKTEKQAIAADGTMPLGGTSLTKVQDPAILTQVLQLQKQLESYQADSETLRKKNKELETTLRNVQTELIKTKSQDSIKPQTSEEIEMIKKNNQALQEKVRLLESVINSIQANPQIIVKENVPEHPSEEYPIVKEQIKEHFAKKLQKDSPLLNNKYSPARYHEEEKQYDSNGTSHSKTTVKTENAAVFPKSLKTDSPDAAENRAQALFFQARGNNDGLHGLHVTKPVRNIFGKTLQLMTGYTDRSIESNGTQGLAHDVLEKIATKRENIEPKPQKSLTLQDLATDSVRPYSNFQSPMSQNSDVKRFVGKNIFSMSPRDGVLKSPGSVSRYEPKYSDRTYDHQVYDRNIHESDKIKGELVSSEIYALRGLQNVISDSGPGDALHKFKISCLRAKSLLYENEFIQVGITTNIMQDYASSKNLLKAMVYFGSKLESEITKFKISIVEGLNLKVTAKPQEVDSVIMGGKQVKQQYLISYTGTPFGCLKVIGEGLFNGKHEAFPIYLPNVITKYMQFKYIEPFEFREKWKYSDLKVLKTQAITLDTKLVENLLDFRRYFGELVELGPKNEIQSYEKTGKIKLAGVFELDIPNVEYMLKINSLPSGQVVFQVAADRRHHDEACYLLQTLIFIFRQ